MTNAVSALRRFARRESPLESCDLCAAPLSEPHEHLLEAEQRRVACACRACALLFPEGAAHSAYRRIVSRAARLPDLRLGSDDLKALGVPVGLVFLGPSRVHDCTFAVYPNAAGATEATLPAAAWDALVETHPALARIQPDVEGLFVSAFGADVEAYHLSIDVCHRIVGLLRSRAGHGVAVRSEIQQLLGTLAGGVDAHA